MTRAYSVLAGVALVASVGCRDAMERTQGYKDEQITAAVEAALRANVPGEIEVSTRDRIVTLSGTVPDAAARERATQIASHTTGVTSVNNGLRATIAADAPAVGPAGLPPAAPVLR
jgi:osmotically-inducible protein OsmY